MRHRDDAKVRFLFFGGVRQNKNLALLIRAFRNLPADLRERAVLQVSGSCPASEIGAYQELVGSDPSIALDFRRIPDREIPDLFLSQHFLVLPYGHVAQSGPQMIAYNYRLPVMATDIPGFRERIEDGLDGYLFRPEDEMHLSEVMAEAIRTHQDGYPRLVENLERRIQKEWEPEIVSELYARMFMKVGQARQEGTLA
ncbi:MAG: glycosyltransferase [Fibrobacteres bacterium]|nr:glycosyltransferase [Fibrobacterota bacterium]